jgi:hypothetical protein
MPIALSDGPIRSITEWHSLSPAILYPLDHWAFLAVGLADCFIERVGKSMGLTRFHNQ